MEDVFQSFLFLSFSVLSDIAIYVKTAEEHMKWLNELYRKNKA